MAQSGYTPISLYYSTTASAAPTSGNLVAGELALNNNDGKLFYKDSSGVVQVLASKGTGTIGGSTTQVQYNNAGAFAGSANMTFDGTSLSLTNQLNLTNASNYNLYASGAGNNYMAGSVGVGAVPIAGTNIYAAKNLTGATNSFNIYSLPTAQSDVTVLSSSYFSFPATQATAFTLASVRHYDLAGVSVGAGSTVTTQVGYYSRALTSATNNYAFQGVVAAATGAYNLYMNGSANNYLGGSLGIGATALTGFNLRVSKTLTGATSSFAIRYDGTIQSDVTSVAYLYSSQLNTQAAAFTLGTVQHYAALQGTIGATSAVTTQVGFNVDSGLTGATNNYGFNGNIAAATGAYNLYMAGTANNYLAGALGIGATTTTGYSLAITKNITGATVAYGAYSNGIVQSDVTSLGGGFTSALGTQATTFTVTSLRQFYAAQGTFGSGSTVSNNYGFFVDANLTGATNNYGFFGNIAAATGRYNLYMSGTADNYLAGALGIGSTSLTGVNFRVDKALTGSTNSLSVASLTTIQSDVTSSAVIFDSKPSTQAAAFTLTSLFHFAAEFATVGATSAITTQYGFIAQSSLTGATNNYGFYGGIAAATGRYNLYMAGTAANYFGGDMQFNKTVTAAGTTGAQTISKNAGTVNFAAAATSLVVTNTLVTTSSIIICTVGTNDTTMKSALAVAAAGSFTIYANAAATAETRVNFIVIN